MIFGGVQHAIFLDPSLMFYEKLVVLPWFRELDLVEQIHKFV